MDSIVFLQVTSSTMTISLPIKEYVQPEHHLPSFNRACFVKEKFPEFLMFSIKLDIDLTLCGAEVFVSSLDCYKEEVSWKQEEYTGYQ